MARYTFGGGEDDYVWTRGSGNVMYAAPASVLTFWSAVTGGTQYTDLLLNASPVTTITADSNGLVPVFSGPDGITSMYASADGAARRLITSPVASSAFQQVSTPEAFGAVGDGTTNDTVAVQAAIDSAKPVWLDPSKTYKVAGLVARNGMQMASMLLPNTGYRASLKTTSGDMWTTPSSGAAFVAGFRFENVIMESATASGGHLMRGMWSQGSFSNVSWVQNNNAKSIFDVTGLIDVSFESECSMQHTTTATVPGFKAVTSTGQLAQVNFTNLRCTNSNVSGVQFFYIEGTSGAVPINFNFENVNFEVCNGGIAKLLSCRHFKFSRVGSWDRSAAATNHLFHIDKSATSGAAPRAITFENFIRDGSTTPTGGAQDIFVASTAGMTEFNVFNCGHQLAGTYLVDAGTSTGRVTGSGVTTLTNGLNMSTDVDQDVSTTAAIAGSGTAKGNGTLTARMKRNGTHVAYRVKFVLGSTSTIGSAITITLPTSEAGSGAGIQSLRAFAIDAGNNFYTVSGTLSTPTSASVYTIGTNGLVAAVDTTHPFTWGTGDALEFAVTYESA